MAKLTGTVRRSDLEGGHWILETTAGERYQLTGACNDLKDGMKAELSGQIAKNQMGIGMTGPYFEIQSVRTL